MQQQKERFQALMSKGEVHPQDKERASLFWILSGNSDIYGKVHHIYDFEENAIKPECLESGDVDFSSSSERLVRLAFNLYNGYPADVLDSFQSLDEDNFRLALEAIKIRFNME